MNAEHPNAVAYRQTADAFRARDFRAIEALVDEDVVWHVPGHHPRAGESSTGGDSGYGSTHDAHDLAIG